MSKWEDNFRKHPVHTTAQSLAEALNDDAFASDNIDVIDLVDRLRQALLYTTSCLDNVVPTLVSQGTLNNVNNYLQTILNELNNYKANKNIAHLNNTSNHIDTLTAQLASLPIPSPKVEGEVFSSSLTSFKEQAKAIIRSLSNTF